MVRCAVFSLLTGGLGRVFHAGVSSTLSNADGATKPTSYVAIASFACLNFLVCFYTGCEGWLSPGTNKRCYTISIYLSAEHESDCHAAQ